jgi:ATP-binding cassette subfamily C (CFTR/MRP) protein 1
VILRAPIADLVYFAARHLNLADNIIVLNPAGSVAMQGSYADLIAQQEFSEFTKTDEIDESSHRPSVPAVQKKKEENTQENPESDKLQDLTRRTGDMKIYIYYFQTIGSLLFVSYLVAQVVTAFVDNFPQIWLAWWTKSGGQLPLYLSVYASLALVSSFSMLVCIWIIFLKVMPRSAIHLHNKLLDTVMSAPLSLFASTNAGVTLDRFSQDMSLVTLSLPIALSSATAALFNCIAKLALVSTVSSYMAITIPFTALAIFCIQNVYLKTSRQLRFLDIENKSPLYSHFFGNH